jgi:hypothetical protein
MRPKDKKPGSVSNEELHVRGSEVVTVARCQLASSRSLPYRIVCLDALPSLSIHGLWLLAV